MKGPKPVSIMCVDDHVVVREGLAAIIGTQSDMTVVAEASDAQSAVEKYREHQPDIVLMDLSMPGVDGIEGIRRIREAFPAARIIVLTAFEGDESIHRALEVGAQAYLLKSSVRQELLQAIREVSSGKRYIPASVAARLAEHTPRVTLSPRELEVLRFIAAGLRNKEIGDKMDIAEDTVKVHIKNIFGKLNVADRTQAAITAAERGIIPLHRSE
jgi:two-component system, NarL family, response regulator